MKLDSYWKRTAALALALAVVIPVAACAPNDGNGDGDGNAESSRYCPEPGAMATPDDPNEDVEGKITFSGWANAQPQAVLAEFQQAYPNVEIEFLDATNEYLTKLQTAMRAGTGAPDISFLQDAHAPHLWEMPVADLSACMAPYLDEFPDFKVKAISRPDGTIQAVPWEAGPVQLVYRRDVFEKYGIDPASLTTWDAFIAAGKKLVADSGGTTYMAMSNQVPPPSGLEAMSNTYLVLAQQNAGNFFDQDGSPSFDDPNLIEAMELIKSFRDEGITLNDVASDQAAYDALANGVVATWVAPTWWKYYPVTFAEGTDGLWGSLPLPAFDEGGARSSNQGGTSIIIPEQTKSPEAAWAFASFWLLRLESRKLSFAASEGRDFDNIFAPAAADPLWNQPDPFFGGDKWLANAAELSQEIPELNVSTQSGFLFEELNQVWPAFLDGSVSAEQTLLDLENAVMAR